MSSESTCKHDRRSAKNVPQRDGRRKHRFWRRRRPHTSPGKGERVEYDWVGLVKSETRVARALVVMETYGDKDAGARPVDRRSQKIVKPRARQQCEVDRRACPTAGAQSTRESTSADWCILIRQISRKPPCRQSCRTRTERNLRNGAAGSGLCTRLPFTGRETRSGSARSSSPDAAGPVGLQQRNHLVPRDPNSFKLSVRLQARSRASWETETQTARSACTVS